METLTKLVVLIRIRSLIINHDALAIQLEETQESARTAVDKAKKKLQLPSPKNIAMVQYQWIGIIDEMVFELAMSLIYELVPDNDESKLDFFIKPDSNPFYHSPLGILITIDCYLLQ